MAQALRKQAFAKAAWGRGRFAREARLLVEVQFVLLLVDDVEDVPWHHQRVEQGLRPIETRHKALGSQHQGSHQTQATQTRDAMIFRGPGQVPSGGPAGGGHFRLRSPCTAARPRRAAPPGIPRVSTPGSKYDPAWSGRPTAPHTSTMQNRHTIAAQNRSPRVRTSLGLPLTLGCAGQTSHPPPRGQEDPRGVHATEAAAHLAGCRQPPALPAGGDTPTVESRMLS